MLSCSVFLNDALFSSDSERFKKLFWQVFDPPSSEQCILRFVEESLSLKTTAGNSSCAKRQLRSKEDDVSVLCNALGVLNDPSCLEIPNFDEETRSPYL